ncbi:MAG: NAD(P)/FAD-dependent oxidoreductase [Nocardioidaceae bacterium]|nr:NAD(P)/FAD-dependent oxidoreductase [Nocardioidaceae bacterium]NUS51455.1 NAD(P)/FAD-dependent oxidoreductase [Nocardioidaceae bacterium]
MTEHVDVLIVGAGLSGIGAACHLEERRPGTSYLVLEARDAIGGTWDLFRYPGIRSDSDMFTMGYRFRPWTDSRSLADGTSILRYVRDTATAYGVDEHVRYRHRVVGADWSSQDATWTVTVDHDGEVTTYTCGFLWCCSGYYRYDRGYLPEFAGVDDFEAVGGTVVHPQHWPEDLDWTGRRVVVVGSGATAVTLVPALAEQAAHVTMLQRSPSYVLSVPATDPIDAKLLARLPAKQAYAIARWKHVLIATGFYKLSRWRPEWAKALLRKGVAGALPAGYDVDTHFNPVYDPWDQRMCFVPDGDLFKAVRRGDADVVTDRIDRFTPTGLRLESGREIEADVVVTATGLNLLAFGGMTLSVDGDEVALPETMAYRGMLLSGVPNFAYVVGYTNASWTLKADLVAEYVCRLLAHLDRHGYDAVVADREDDVTEEPFLDFSSGYVQRSLHLLPKQGSRTPWRLRQSYLHDLRTLRRAPLDDGVLRWSRVHERASA